VASSSRARPVATTRGERGGAEQHVGEVAARDAAQHLVHHRLQLLRPGRVGDPRRRPGRTCAICRPRVELPRDRRRVGRTPMSAARTAATGSPPVSPPESRPTPRRWSRCPRSRPGAAPGRRPAGRRSPGHRGPAGSRPGPPPRSPAPGRHRRRSRRRTPRPGASGGGAGGRSPRTRYACGPTVTGPMVSSARASTISPIRSTSTSSASRWALVRSQGARR
jgi:hypothetical protein